LFGNKILKTEYDFNYIFSKINHILFNFFKNKLYFIQLFLNKLYFIQFFLKKSNLKIRKQNKNSILILKIQNPNEPLKHFSLKNDSDGPMITKKLNISINSSYY
jgi:hypothetical protein